MSINHPRLQELFLNACDLPESQQIALMDEQCADDPEMRRELLRLLQSDARESGLFADEQTTDGIQFRFDTVIESVLPEFVGRYRVKRVLGEGGMGVVYLAEQQNPAREVAVKVIRSGFADRQSIGRFEAERQALSMMDHRNIARVLDAGETEHGTPYFVMELVQGDPITKFCDVNKLTANERLELFVQACDAIQHAHHKGIIHRDLKPSNILVDVHDGQPRVKVIDFGLAKALEHQAKLTDKTVFTELGKVVGTVQYMSPEQARLDIDTRTDIYSLGVILYELLTGSTPLEKETMQAHAVLQVLDIIRRQDPPRPSDRLRASLDGQDSIGALRQIQPAKLQQILKGELDWVIMRALEKDRRRRYASPHDFAGDVRRYLQGDAVEARPPSTGYRFRKFVGKNRVAAGISVGVLTLVAGATAAVFSYAIKADASAKRSEAILSLVADSFQSVDPVEGADVTMSAKEVLVNAKNSLEHSNLDATGKRKFLSQLSSSFFDLGEYDLSLDAALQWHQFASTDLGPEHPETLKSMHNLATSYHCIGKTSEAIELLEKTLKLRQAKLGPEHLDTLYSMMNLAGGYCEIGKTAEAVELFERTFTIRKAKLGPSHPHTLISMANLAVGYRMAGRTTEAIDLMEQSLKIRTFELGSDHPDTLMSAANLAAAYRGNGRTRESLELQQQTLTLRTSKLGTDHPQTLWSMRELADSHCDAGQISEAIELHAKAFELSKAKLGSDHPHTLDSMNSLADAYRTVGRTVEATELLYQTYQNNISKLGTEHPKTLKSMHNLANCYSDAGRTEDAIELFKQTVETRGAVLGFDHPDTLTSMGLLATTFYDAGRTLKAMELWRRKYQLNIAKLGLDDPKTITSINTLVWSIATTPGTLNQLDQQLMDDMRRACAGSEDGGLFNTLAIAEYRLENFEMAIEAASVSIEKMPPPAHPFNLAILAMSHQRLDHESEPSEFRKAFDDAMQSEPFMNDSDCQEFATEVEELFGTKKETDE